jgi:hypothetical protein
MLVDQMMMAGHILAAIERGDMPMHPSGYQEIARWASAAFGAMDACALRALRDAAPAQLQGLIENVMHERRVVCWTAWEGGQFSAQAHGAALLRRCRRSPPATD